MSIHLHIVPSIPPAFNGLGDYCYQLWKHWPSPRPEWHVAAAVVPEGAKEAWPEIQIHGFEHSDQGLFETLQQSKAETVVLHYVGYGYERRGAPGWLPKALADWKEASGGKLVVMFHELYATGPPWKSEFWFCLPQKRIASQLAKLADRWITSCPRYVRVLCDILGAEASTGEMIPVGSNIEPIQAQDEDRPWPPETGGKIKIAVFGMPLTRVRALRAHTGLLRSLLERNLIEEVLLIGKSDKSGTVADETKQFINSSGMPSLFVEALDLPVEEVSRTLLACHIGLVQNSFEILYKSTAYSAFATHGVLPIIPSDSVSHAGNFLENNESKPQQTIDCMGKAFHAQGVEGQQFLTSSTALRFAAVCGSEA